MAKSESAAATATKGLLALGVGALVAAALSSGPDRRAAFVQRLRDQLMVRGVTLVAAELGRTGEQGLWVLTLQLPNQHVIAVHAPVEPSFDPLALEVADHIALRVLQHFL